MMRTGIENTSELSLLRRRCNAIVPNTGKQCKAPAVAPGTNRKKVIKNQRTGKKKKVTIFNPDGTPIKNDPDRCQMHQPTKERVCRCHCHEKLQTIDEMIKKTNIQIQLTPEQTSQIMGGDNNFLNLTKVQLEYLHTAFGSRPVEKTKKHSKNKSRINSKKK